MANNIEIIIGTYEEYLLGFKLENKNDKFVLTQSFADKSHSGAIKCLDVHQQWIATGSTDDRIVIYDMKQRKQAQMLLTHDGTINALSFTPDGSHLLSGGADGCLSAVRLGTWIEGAQWKKAHHGKPVTHVSCHPGSTLALSLGADLVLSTWNLVKGRVSYRINLKSKAEALGNMIDCLAWSPVGDHFTLSGARAVQVWTIKAPGGVVCSRKTNSKPICVSWLDEDICLFGLEDGNILWLNKSEAQQQQEIILEAHETRVKAIKCYGELLVSACSTGEIKVWQINKSKPELEELASTNIGCRPTCLNILDLEQFGDLYELGCHPQQHSEKLAELPEVEEPKTETAKERGKVTIEYDNDEDEDDDKLKETKQNKKPNIIKTKTSQNNKKLNKKQQNASSDEDESDDHDDDEVSEGEDEQDDDEVSEGEDELDDEEVSEGENEQDDEEVSSGEDDDEPSENEDELDDDEISEGEDEYASLAGEDDNETDVEDARDSDGRDSLKVTSKGRPIVLQAQKRKGKFVEKQKQNNKQIKLETKKTVKVKKNK